MNIKDFQIYIRDSLQHIDLMKSRHPDLPVFIVGHSMVRHFPWMCVSSWNKPCMSLELFAQWCPWLLSCSVSWEQCCLLIRLVFLFCLVLNCIMCLRSSYSMLDTNRARELAKTNVQVPLKHIFDEASCDILTRKWGKCYSSSCMVYCCSGHASLDKLVVEYQQNQAFFK